MPLWALNAKLGVDFFWPLRTGVGRSMPPWGADLPGAKCH